MKITKKLLEEYIRKVMKESWRSRYRDREREREMNYGVGGERIAQSDWYADDDYQPPKAPMPKSNMEKALRIEKYGTNEQFLSAMVSKAEQLAASVMDEASFNNAMATIAEELAVEFSNNFSKLTGDKLLQTKGRTIKTILDAAVKDSQGVPPTPYGS